MTTISTARTATVPIIKSSFRLMPLCTRPSQNSLSEAPHFIFESPDSFPDLSLRSGSFSGASSSFSSAVSSAVPVSRRRSIIFPSSFRRSCSSSSSVSGPCPSSESCSSRSGSSGSCSGCAVSSPGPLSSASAFPASGLVSGSSSSSSSGSIFSCFLRLCRTPPKAPDIFCTPPAQRSRSARNDALVCSSSSRIFSNSSSSNPSSS